MAKKGTLFRQLAAVFDELEKTSSSLRMIEILAAFFKRISPEDARMSAYLLAGKLGPDYKGPEFGLAEKLVVRSIAKAVGKSPIAIEKIFHKKGDLGSAAEDLVPREAGAGLSLREIFKGLEAIAFASGPGSQEKKLTMLAELISKCSSLEAKYIIRIVLGTLRLGVAEMIFLAGLSKALAPLEVGRQRRPRLLTGLTGSKEKKKILENAFNVFSDLGEVAYQAVSSGVEALKNAKPIVGVPIRMMLAKRVEDLKEAGDHIRGEVFVEYKYDGERIQSHISEKAGIVLFSRRHENITHQFPDVVRALKKSFKGKSAIVEGEAVAIDKDTGKFQPFQVLMTRRRKHGVEEQVKKVPVEYCLFDALYLDGKPLLNFPLFERKAFLEKCFSGHDGISHAKYIRAKDAADVESFFLDVTRKGAEGVMIKDAASPYEAGTRAWKWIKYKKDYGEELADTFDLVVVGGLYGAGKRAGTYGSLLVAAYGPETNKYYSFTKVGTGFTDEDLSKLPKMLDKYKLGEKHRLVETEMEADAWFEPVLVTEVRGAELTKSPVHTVAKDKMKIGGLALRFPRFIRWRSDKSPEQVTTTKEIYELYRGSKRK